MSELLTPEQWAERMLLFEPDEDTPTSALRLWRLPDGPGLMLVLGRTLNAQERHAARAILAENIRAAEDAQRERCAKICDGLVYTYAAKAASWADAYAQACAAAIRQKGEPT